jgi:HK97 family phage prohead protease
MESMETRASSNRATVERAEGRRIIGTPIVFNSLSHVLRDKYIGPFRERIRPEAVDRTLNQALPVKALWNHNADLVLGNTRAGTLALRKMSNGLFMSLEPPRWADPQMETIERGDVDGMSFAFGVTDGGDDWEFDTADGIPIRDVMDMTFKEVSVVAFPAYPATEVSVSQRSLDRFTEVCSARRGMSIDLARKLHQTRLA